MEVFCKGKNLYIIGKSAAAFQEVSVENGAICLKDEAGNIVQNGNISAEQVYACLYCKSLRNITLIVRAEDIYKASLVLDNEERFGKVLDLLKGACGSAQIAEQNKKINGYAAAVVEKLQEGVELGIIETREEGEIPCCPVCGVHCDPGIPFCMECGASLE